MSVLSIFLPFPRQTFGCIRRFFVYARLEKHTMPKKHLNAKKTTSDKGSSQLPSSGSCSVVKDAADGTVVIKVLAKPGARFNGITEISEEGVGVQIAAPPVDGEANTELVKYLSKLLNVRKSDVTLDKGSKSRNKSLSVTGTTADQVIDKMKMEIENG